jgi:hypothetical protein
VHVACSSLAHDTCVVAQDGSVWCAGENAFGQLGNGECGEGSAVPVKVIGLEPEAAVAVALAERTACALTASGRVFCWGDAGPAFIDGPRREECGGTGVPVPTLVDGLPGGISAVSMCIDNACALDGKGGVWCWGTEVPTSEGLGLSVVPQPVSLPVPAAAVVVGGYVSCGLTPGTGVSCWGKQSDYHAFGTPGAPDEVAEPILVAGTASATGVSLWIGSGVVVLLADSSLLHWGSLILPGRIPDSRVPVPLAGLFPPAVAVGSGDASLCVLDEHLDPWCLDHLSCLKDTCPSAECPFPCPDTPVKVEIPQD